MDVILCKNQKENVQFIDKVMHIIFSIEDLYRVVVIIIFFKYSNVWCIIFTWIFFIEYKLCTLHIIYTFCLFSSGMPNLDWINSSKCHNIFFSFIIQWNSSTYIKLLFFLLLFCSLLILFNNILLTEVKIKQFNFFFKFLI